MSYGANRNLLVKNTDLDPLSQTSPLNSQAVRVDPVAGADGTRETAQGGAITKWIAHRNHNPKPFVGTGPPTRSREATSARATSR